MKAYYEDLWQRLPARLDPPDLDRRVGFMLEHLRPGMTVLDLGCGDGVFSELMLEHVEAELTLADVAPAALARARTRPRLARAHFVEVPFDGPLPLDDNRFDLVWASEVIEHVADTAAWLSEVRRVLTPGGTLALTTPNHPRLRLLTHGIGRLAPPLGDHLHLYDRASLTMTLGEFGFASVEVRAAGRLGPWSGLLLGAAHR